MMVYGLIGASLSHSFSQRWFTEKFQREGLAHHRYDLFPLAQVEALQELIRDTNGLAGLNVTIPYKQAVMPLLDELDAMATAVGAVNTIVLREGRTIGHNTDVEGFHESLLEVLGTERPRALVLGSGGASRAVAFVLRELGIRFRVVSRSPERGDLTWDLLDPIIVKVCPLIVNTTPLGMFPDVEGMPALPFEAIGPRHLLYDLIYNPAETGFLKEGRARGARTLNGQRMLEAQAEASWRLWQRP
jgi:shikimate dehydrogenase